MLILLMGDKMKKNNNMQSNKAMNQNSKINNCNKKEVSNKSNNKVNGFSNESKSFELDENEEHSFELR